MQMDPPVDTVRKNQKVLHNKPGKQNMVLGITVLFLQGGFCVVILLQKECSKIVLPWAAGTTVGIPHVIFQGFALYNHDRWNYEDGIPDMKYGW